MADISYGLDHLLSVSWPTRNDIENDRVHTPDIYRSICARLDEHRWCWMVGPPRSGKSVLTHLLAWEVERGERPNLYDVRGLDLSEISDPESDIAHITLNAIADGWLLIVDNWHASPESHPMLLKLLGDAWKRRATILVVSTVFPDEGETGAGLSPHPPSLSSETVALQVSGEVVAETARAMALLHITALGERSPASPLGLGAPLPPHLLAETLEMALVVPSAHKKVRGNLRFLSWRLAAWDARKQHLSEVGVDQVLEHVRQEIVGRAGENVGDLERIAALAQWELPFVRRTGEGRLVGLEELRRLNLVQEVQKGLGWRMDSTDAYLLLVAQCDTAWLQESARLLIDYLNGHLTQAAQAVQNVSLQTSPDVRTKLVLTLLEKGALLEAVAASLESALRQDGNINRITSLVNTLLRRLPEDGVEAERRFATVARLLGKVDANNFGAASRRAPLLKLGYFLMHCRRDRDRLRHVILGLLEGYGRDNLIKAIDAAPSGGTQRFFLRGVSIFDGSLGSELRQLVMLKPQRRKKDLRFFLQQGTIRAGKVRQRSVVALAQIDERVVLELARTRRGLQSVQSVLYSAQWLSGNDAARIAAHVSENWKAFKAGPQDFGYLSFLLQNCAEADYESGQRLLDHAIADVRPSAMPGCDALGLSRFLVACERVRPGVLKGLYESETEGLAAILLSTKDEEARNALLLTLGSFDNETLNSVLAAANKRQRGWTDGALELAMWTRVGIMASYGYAPPSGVQASPQAFVSLATIEPAQAFFALHGLQRSRGDRVVADQLEQLASEASLASWIPMLVGRYPMPWSDGDVRAVVSRVLRSGAGSRARVLSGVIVAALETGQLRWPMLYQMDPYKTAHRSLQTCIHERVLLVNTTEERGSVIARPSAGHPLVRTAHERVGALLTALGFDMLTLHDWDSRLQERVSLEELDHWRAKLLKLGRINWKVDRGPAGWKVVFVKEGPIDRGRVYDLLKLPNPWTLSPATSTGETA